MTPKEIRKILEEHRDKVPYLRQPSAIPSIGLFARISRAELLRNARHVTRFETGTYLKLRPNLDPGHVVCGDYQCIAFVIEP